MWEFFHHRRKLRRIGQRCVKTFNGLLIALAQRRLTAAMHLRSNSIRAATQSVDTAQPELFQRSSMLHPSIHPPIDIALNFLSRVGYAI